MKICLAQSKAIKGNVDKNIANHLKWIEIAILQNADLIVFPELSITGYEPKLAKKVARNKNDTKLDIFQEISDKSLITIAIGIPTKTDLGILISMLIFQPNQQRIIYSKQKLHSDELPYFIPGSKEIILSLNNNKIAPAICYEALQPEHIEKASKMGAELYIASVAKSQIGIDKAFSYFSTIAKQNSMPIFMVNCIGYCDNFQSVGQSSIWNKNGTLMGQLNNNEEGLLIFDTYTEEIIKFKK